MHHATTHHPCAPELDEVEQRLPIPSDVLVAERDDLPSGNGWWVPAQRVLFLAAGLSQAQRTFTLAHEVAHILLGHHAGMGPAKTIEVESESLTCLTVSRAAPLPSRLQSR